MLLLVVTGCDKQAHEFGFDGAISGKIVDQAGNIVAGDITSTALSVKALGQGDIVTIDMRVKGDGTFQNTKMFPKMHKIYVTGPVTPVDDTLRIIFSTAKTATHDFVSVPFITIDKPALVGNPDVTFSYTMTPNGGKTVAKRGSVHQHKSCTPIPAPVPVHITIR